VWAWVGNTLYKTLDGGRHWQALARNLPLAGTPEFQFLNASVGYAVSGDAGSSGFRPYLKTVDGGRT
jgi:photosystem II stability/assembly factor-like uncharacterized protein